MKAAVRIALALLALAPATLAPATLPAAASDVEIDLAAAEREHTFAAVAVAEVPVRRHLLVEQQQVLWLPESFKAVSAKEASVARFEAPAPLPMVAVARREFSPGVSLLQTVDNGLRQLAEGGAKLEVLSRRRLHVASRPAVEVTASLGEGEAASALRMVWISNAAANTYHVVRLEGPDAAAADGLLRRLLRDYSPLDHGLWSSAFERARRGLGLAESGLAFDQRHQLFAALTQAGALAEAELGGKLRELAREHGTALLVDGAWHPHPRVRIATYEALDPAALPAASRGRLLAFAAMDPDPAARWRLARRLAAAEAAAPGLSAEILAHTFDSDSDQARGAALQLIAASPVAMRRSLLKTTAARLGELPLSSQLFTLHLFAAWGTPESQVPTLQDISKRSRHERVKALAWRLLLERGEVEALAMAQQRLEKARGAGLLELEDAAHGLALHATAEHRERLEQVAATLAAEAPGDGEVAKQIQRARTTLQGVLTYLESPPKDLAADCAALLARRRDGNPAWARQRRQGLACNDPKATPFAAVSVSRPGAVLAELMARVGRLSLASPQSNDLLQAILGQLNERLASWAGDPVTSVATGLDLSAPLAARWWATGRGEDANEPELGVSFALPVHDLARLIDSVVRVSQETADLSEVSPGLFVGQLAPFLPLVLFTAWGEEREHVVGKDDNSSTTEPPRRFIALAPEPGAVPPTSWELSRLVLDGNDGATWSKTRLLARGGHLLLEQGAPADEATPSAAEAGEAVAPEALATRVEVDLTTFLRLITSLAAKPDKPADEAAVPDGLRLSLSSDLTAPGFVLQLELAGLSPTWRAAFSPPPGNHRAPAELLPKNTLVWLGLRLAKEPIAALIAESRESLEEALGAAEAAKLKDAASIFEGEIGFALVGIAEPGKTEGEDPWLERLVAYAAVDPKAADRYLAKHWPKSERFAGLRLHQLDDAVAARIGGFVVLTARRELLAELAKAPFFAGSLAYQEIVSAAPPEAPVLGGFDTELLATDLTARLEARQAEGGTLFLVEALRALGRIRTSAHLEGERLVGEVSIQPHERAADGAPLPAPARYVGFTAGSVDTAGFPAAWEKVADHLAALELALQLPGDAAVPDFAWANERLEPSRPTPRLYRLRSKAAVPLPETSKERLPIQNPEVLPYLRNEHNLDLHTEALKERAQAIRGDEEDPAKLVRAIVRWAHTSLDYSMIRRSPRVEEILTSRQADCTEFSQLTVALARSLGIPARFVNGIYVGPEGAILHRWAEVYLDRWYEIDPTFGVVAVPAASLRLPGNDGSYLATHPGSRFTFLSAVTTDGKQVEGEKAP